jgi:hypothetical protein
MVRSGQFNRSPALILALLAVLGLLGWVNPPPAPGTIVLVGLDVPLCHAGLDGKHPANHPGRTCDACLLCIALHGHSPETPLIPAGFVPVPLSVARLHHAWPAIAITLRDLTPGGPWARAPPRAV